MSETDKGLNETPNQVNDTNSELNKETEVVKDPQAVLAKNSELLGKNKSLSQKLKDVEEKLKVSEQSKLEEQGKFKELYEHERTARQKERANNAYAHLQSQIASKASSLGCVDSDLLMSVVDVEALASTMDDDTFRVDGDTLQQTLEKIKADKPFLFKKSSPSVGSNLPNTTTGSNRKQTTKLKDVSKDDLISRVKALHGSKHS